MLNFIRVAAGIYQARQDGAKLNINREGANYWALRLDGEFVDAFATLGSARVAAQGLVGAVTLEAHDRVTLGTPKAKLPAIMHNPKGLYVFGLDEICELLASTMDDSQVIGECRPHTTKRGKQGYFVDAIAAPAFWDACSEETPGTAAICMGEGKKWEVRL